MGMAKYDRLLYILNLLRSRRNLNAANLATECGVTERSIYRDMVALSEANVPIYYDNGYKLASSNFLPPMNFDLDEYLSLKMALESTPLQETDKHRRSLKHVRTKLDAVISDQVRRQSRFAPCTTHLHITTTQEEERGAEFYSAIEEAATGCWCLKIRYSSIESGDSERVVEPYFIVFRGRAFYFVAYCRLRKEIRTFRLDRVQQVDRLAERFLRKDEITAETYFEKSWQVYCGEPVKVRVKLRGAAARVVIAGQHAEGEQIEQQDDGSVMYTVTVRGVEEIKRWILGFGAEAEVLEPEDLRRSVARTISELGELYQA